MKLTEHMKSVATPLEQNSSDLPYWLAVNHIYGFGIRTLLLLLQHFDEEIKAIFQAPELVLQQLQVPSSIIQGIKQVVWKDIEKELAWVAASGHHHVITFQNDAYPILLKEIASPPPVLFVMGDPSCLSQPQLAIVGSRNPTPAGKESAEQFAEYLAGCGVVITSGLALGIDAAGHRGALQAGKTVAVLGTGIDRVYPKSHLGLARKIVENGAVVSEFPLGVLPEKHNFPRRNRIISGLSLGVLIVEAALQSGSLITAHHAGEQGREVFAIPGSIYNPMSKGCHQLIREGAALVESADDIFQMLQKCHQSLLRTQKIKQENREKLDFSGWDEDYMTLLSCIGFETTAVDTLIKRSNFSSESVASMLLMLELKGYIISVPGGYCRKSHMEKIND